jgi:hypothetical protein
VISNAELAQQLVRRADKHMYERKVLLVTAVALGQTRTPAAARRVLSDPEACIPAAIRSAALTLIDQLTATTERTPPC